MFAALAVIFEGGIEGAAKLRQVAADEIRRDPDNWSEVILGWVPTLNEADESQPRDSYIRKISSPDAWGGAIGESEMLELS